ncbi:MAG: hypothetical protein WD081_06635 [Gammaproteobacteria bacterium]
MIKPIALLVGAVLGVAPFAAIAQVDVPNHPLLGTWTGSYEWDCGFTNPVTGETFSGQSDIVFEVEQVFVWGQATGNATYLGETRPFNAVMCAAVVDSEWVGWAGCDGVQDVNGSYVMFNTDATESSVNNTFYGVINANYDAIVGGTLNGDSGVAGHTVGCSAPIGYAGEFAVTTSRVSEPTSIDDCKKGNWEQFGFSNQGRCIQYLNTGKDSR